MPTPFFAHIQRGTHDFIKKYVELYYTRNYKKVSLYVYIYKKLWFLRSRDAT